MSPVSSERYRPRLRPSASMTAQTRPALAGDAATPILPWVPSGIPSLRLMLVQVSPPSRERHSPQSGPPESMDQKVRLPSQMVA